MKKIIMLFNNKIFKLLVTIVLTLFTNITPSNAEVFQGREYEFYRPKRSDSPPRAAVFVLHGGKSDSKRVRSLTEFDKIAEQYNVVAIYPSSPDQFWNDGRGVTLSSDPERDDGLYLSSLAEHLYQQKVIPSKKAFFIGISNGGGMSMYMACQYPEKTAGISVIATKLPTALDCRRYQPVPTLFFHGDKDKLSPHSGRARGDEGIAGKNAGTNYSSLETSQIWAKLNKCQGTISQKTLDNLPEDGTIIKGYKFENCQSPLEYYVIEGGGHTWPGALEPDIGRFAKRMLGNTSKEINASKQSLDLWLTR